MVSLGDFPVQDVLGLANSEKWLGVGVTFLLSTLVAGIVLILIAGIASRKWGEEIKVQNAFFLVIIVNVINFFGLGFLGDIVPSPVMFVLPVLVWILLTKVFFSGFSIVHALIIGVLGYAITLFAVPYLVVILAGFFPTAGL